MLANQIKNEGILRNLISLNNLVQSEIEFLLDKLPINYSEFSILMYISQSNITQYMISKKYHISVQRVNQIINKLEKYGYVKKIDEIKNGRIGKRLIIDLKIEKQLDEINNGLIEIFKNKNIDYENLIIFNNTLKIFLNNLRDQG